MSRPRVAYGCTIASSDDVDAKLVWMGRMMGYAACRTRRGCWHIELCCKKNATTAIAAEVCMSSQDQLLAVAEMFEGLPLEGERGQIHFLEVHLPDAARQTDERELGRIRAEILRP